MSARSRTGSSTMYYHNDTFTASAVQQSRPLPRQTTAELVYPQSNSTILELDMVLPDLPVELVFDILTIALQDEPVPTNILCVSSGFHSVGRALLYEHLRFRSLDQLVCFSKESYLPCLPRYITLDFTGKSNHVRVFEYLRDALRRIKNSQAAATGLDEHGRIPLTSLSFRLHSYSRDDTLHCLSDVMSLVNPVRFAWVGPDPEHHFSTAIVSRASTLLFRAFEFWTNIQYIKVTNIAFSSTATTSLQPLIAPIPSLRTLHIGQATFLSPFALAVTLSSEGMVNLQQVRLVDTYVESIWGRRLRSDAVESAYQYMLDSVGDDDGNPVPALSRVRSLLQCEKKTERITGGDRVEAVMIVL